MTGLTLPADRRCSRCRPKSPRNARAFGVSLLALLLTAGAILAAAPSDAAEPAPILFYSSETNINNFKTLKTGFDTLLSASGQFTFQPVTDPAVFEETIKSRPQCAVVTSSWMLRRLKASLAFKVLLVGERDGRKTQKRLLVTSRKSLEMGEPLKGPVAAAGNEAYSRVLLKELITDAALADSLRILPVPKDIDALMSVGFQMAKAALTSEAAFGTLQKLDPSLHGKLGIVAEGPESPLLVVAAPDTFTGADALVRFFGTMAQTLEGRQIVKMIDLDGWQPPDASDLSRLEERQ